ncbi:MAG: hypothetical protein WCP08_10470 [Prolixibacteraceae bacterium]
MSNSINSIVRPKAVSIPKLIGFIVFFLLSYSASSQDGSKIFTSVEPFEPAKTGNFSAVVDNLNFFKNNEYKSEYVVGYTLSGAWIRPKLLYYPDKNLRLELGAQVLTYSGREDYEVHPWFSVLYKPVKGLSFRMGNLDQDCNHGIADPVMDSEHFFKEKPEAGIQAKYNSLRVNTDFWIDWQKVIFKGDPFKERFVFGTVASFTLFQTDQLKLTFPLVFNGVHEGGEIDSAPGLAETHIVVSEGLKYEYKTGGPLIKSGRLEFSFLQSTYPQSKTALPGKSGLAFYIQTAMNTDWGSFGTGFWQGNRFYTPLGNPIFQNGAKGQSEATSLNRFWVFSYRYDHKIFDQSKFGFTSDMFYNPVTQKLSNSAALYLMVNLSVIFRKTGI